MPEDRKQDAKQEPAKEVPKERDYYNRPQSEKTNGDQSGASQAGVHLYSSWSGGRER